MTPKQEKACTVHDDHPWTGGSCTCETPTPKRDSDVEKRRKAKEHVAQFTNLDGQSKELVMDDFNAGYDAGRASMKAEVEGLKADRVKLKQYLYLYLESRDLKALTWLEEQLNEG